MEHRGLVHVRRHGTRTLVFMDHGTEAVSGGEIKQKIRTRTKFWKAPVSLLATLFLARVVVSIDKLS